MQILWRRRCSRVVDLKLPNRELEQSRRRRQRERHKFAYLTTKNNSFARFARAFFIFSHFTDVLVLSTTWIDLFCSCVDDVSIWWQIFNFVLLSQKRWLQFNYRIYRTHFASVMTLNNCEIISETRSCHRRRLCLIPLIKLRKETHLLLDCKRCSSVRECSFSKLKQNWWYSKIIA